MTAVHVNNLETEPIRNMVFFKFDLCLIFDIGIAIAFLKITFPLLTTETVALGICCSYFLLYHFIHKKLYVRESIELAEADCVAEKKIKLRNQQTINVILNLFICRHSHLLYRHFQ